MRYIGGKSKIGKKVATFIQDSYEFNTYIEPFCGMCGVLRHIKSDKKIGSDANKYVISLLNDIKEGWEPPENISEQEYNEIKNNKDKYSNSLVAFAGFGCSFGGKWFGGYARSKDVNFAKCAKHSLLKIKPLIFNCTFINCSYDKINLPDYKCVIYCDPPYLNTTKVGLKDSFNHDDFWNWVRETSKNHIVLVSEFEAPSDFKSVWSLSRKLNMNVKLTKTENLFTLIGGLGDKDGS